ncbi:MAG: response regulator [Oscillospiraceae bacterium]|nr:response regulator [Oscillospiraceae bacterium]
MRASRGFSVRELFKTMGARSVFVSMLMFLLTVAVTCVVGFQFYRTTKDNIHLQGRVNAVQSAKELDGYILVRKNTVILASHVVDEMIRERRSNDEILDYLTAESLSIKKSIDKDYTGLYGWINGEYLDGDGWVPEPDYMPTERPWYLETIADNGDITFVTPYIDAQTGAVLTTLSEKLSDGVSVIALDVTLSRVQEITEENARQTPGCLGIVLDETGQVIAHSDRAELGKNYLEETDTLGAALAEKLRSGDSGAFELSYQGQKYMVISEKIGGDWQSVSLINIRVFYRPLMIVMSLLILFTILEAIVFLTIIYNQSVKNLAIASAEAAENASRAKSRFLSRMSHEIRTPINAIIGLDSIALRDESIPPHTRDELNKIGASARHLLSIINDILDMSRIESGRMELREEKFSFRDFLEQICIIVDGQCEDKGLRFVCSREEGLEEYYIGDSLKLKQVLINVLGNSVKFTDAPGTITFDAAQIACDDERATLRFVMTDTGIGMDKEFIPRLFEAFSQEDTGNSTRYGGSGLGMAITRSFVEMMGGTIRVESEKGLGSSFTVTVTLGRAKENEKAETAGKEAKSAEALPDGLHLLIVEDQKMNAEVLADLLELENMSSEWAENGRRGVEMFAESEKGRFDAILMDMRMPVMDGLTATRKIRKLNRPDASTIPIIALSANAFEEDVRQCLEAGMNAHLSKPVDLDRLKETLGRLLETRTEQTGY